MEEPRAELTDKAVTLQTPEAEGGFLWEQLAEEEVVVVREVSPAPPTGTHWDGLGLPVRDGGFSWCIMGVSAALQPVGLLLN